MTNGGGMFGLSDNSAQASDINNQAADSPASSQPNPFADAVNPPAPQPPAHLTPVPPHNPDLPQPPAPIPAAPELGNNDDLLDLKEQALSSLQPLVGHLDQTPEEKFKTTMMLIQATDNPALVKEAYQAASQITDEKARAQALLDVVNEINYFTQHGAEAADQPQL